MARPRGPLYPPQGPDTASPAAVEMLGAIIGALIILQTLAWAASLPSLDHSSEIRQFNNLRQDTQQMIILAREHQPPNDPTASDNYHDRAMQSWATRTDHVEGHIPNTLPPASAYETYIHYYPTKGLNNDHRILTKQGPWIPQGQRANTGLMLRPAPHGPMHLTPLLENTTGQATQQLTAIPLTKMTSYTVGALREHDTWLATTTNYTRTLPDPTSTPGFEPTIDLDLEQHAWTELTGGIHPLIRLHYTEPDWIEAAEDPLSFPDEDTIERHFALALTDESLAAERLVKLTQCTLGGDITPDECDELDAGAWPHHQFEINLELQGPGDITYALRGAHPHGTQHEVPDTYQLQITIPASWTDVYVTAVDRDRNDFFGWHNTTVANHTSPTGNITGHTITTYLNTTLTHTTNIPNPTNAQLERHTLPSGTTITAPFRFHARPPTITPSTDLGFHQLQATATNTAWNHHQTATLTVELSNNAGRVNRQTIPHAPSTIPTTPITGGLPEGVFAQFGATFINGAEATTINHITWTATPGTFMTGTGSPEPILDFTTTGEPLATNWHVSPDRSTLTWQPPSPATCPEISTCSVAATLHVSDPGLPKTLPWPKPSTVALYDDKNTRRYIDHFIRSDKAYTGIPNDAEPPGFRTAHQHDTATGGPIPNSYTINLPPTTTPICNDNQLKNRNNPGDHAPYHLGPVENGYPRTAPSTDPKCLGQGNPLNDPYTKPFTILTHIGTNAQIHKQIKSIGRTTYTSNPGIPAETYVSWGNGASESWIEPPNPVRPGDTATFTVHLESLVAELYRTNIHAATFSYKLTDPYNAWEGYDWTKHTSIRDELEYRTDWWCSDTTGSLSQPCPYGDVADTLTVEVDIPPDTPPGTHLFTTRVTWAHNQGLGGTEYQTANVVATFDVLMPQGVMGFPGVISQTSWLKEWG